MLFLLPLLFFVASTEELILPRETAELTHDLAQLTSYGHSPSELSDLAGIYTIWVDEQQFFPCNYRFKYCTERIYESRRVKICAAACST
ncbi:MAG: hypothetical protein GOV00_03240 [Candidatus Altiarchaeota archaeon]|nr:hypothetical protein [Candidatus Altiarchaeota archaeon]